MYKRLLFLFISILLIWSCNTAPKPIPDDISPDNLLQMAQESVVTDKNDEHAIYYYKEFIKRFPDLIQKTIEAEYEIAFITYSRGDYEEAKKLFEIVKSKYEGENAEVLPEWPLTLTKKILIEIDEKLAEKDDKGKK